MMWLFPISFLFWLGSEWFPKKIRFWRREPITPFVEWLDDWSE